MKTELVSKAYAILTKNGLEIISAVARHGTIKRNGKLAFLMKHKHWSPLQHIFSKSHYDRLGNRLNISSPFFEFSRNIHNVTKIPSHEEIELRMEHPTNRQKQSIINPVLKGDFDTIDGVKQMKQLHII
jgi:hypothetical protein